jgi:hypothetical protein
MTSNHNKILADEIRNANIVSVSEIEKRANYIK